MNQKEEKKAELGTKEKRIRNLTTLYYSRKDVQKAIFDFSENREVVPSYMMESFGKRPDSLQYPGDVFGSVKKGATSFHCSEELWKDPLQLSTGMNEDQMSDLRTGWDLLFDIDSKYLDYSKVFAEIIVKILNFYGVKNVGIKFSGSKGFHIIIPWKAFPKEINNVKTSEMFPEWPRIVTKFIIDSSKKELIKRVTILTAKADSSKYVKDFQAPKELEDFQPKDADPLKVTIKNFMPDSVEGEAADLLREALDWHKNQNPEEKINTTTKPRDFKPVKILNLSDEFLPPSIKKILQGINDGRKRAVFILLNLFRSIGMEKEELEKRIYEWNERNKIPLKKGYIKTQIAWSYRKNPVPPPNYDKDYYRGIGIIPTEEELRLKNPLNYIVRKTFQKNSQNKKSKKRKPRKQ